MGCARVDSVEVVVEAAETLVNHVVAEMEAAAQVWLVIMDRATPHRPVRLMVHSA